MRVHAKPLTGHLLRTGRHLGATAMVALAILAPSSLAMPQVLATSGSPVATHAPQGKSSIEQTSLQIVVRFKDDSRVTAIVATYWKDPDTARAGFDAFKRSWPELASAKLVRVTYSNELVLEFPYVPAQGRGRPAAARDLAARLSSLPGVAYAEPDLTFSTQQD